METDTWSDDCLREYSHHWRDAPRCSCALSLSPILLECLCGHLQPAPTMNTTEDVPSHGLSKSPAGLVLQSADEQPWRPPRANQDSLLGSGSESCT